VSGYRENPRPALEPDEEYARGVLKGILEPGETCVWAHRPKRGFIYEPNPNAFLNVVWTLFSLLWVGCGFLTDVSWPMALLGAPFVALGIHGLIGHYLLDARRRRHLVYAITNRRLLVATPSRLIAAPSLGELRTHIVKRGAWGHLRVISPRLELRAVPNVEEVQRLLLEAQAAVPDSGP
jgi:hypothetical protein